MPMSDFLKHNFIERIQSNPYPGRGIVMGVGEDGRLLQLYWIMGRSANSRNRVFQVDGVVLSTQPADPTKMQDPSLVIYEAMLEQKDIYLVSNGDQTRTIHQSMLKAGDGFEAGLTARDREPDAPNYTPRITGMIDLRSGRPFYRFAIVKANVDDQKLSDRHFFNKEFVAKGKGFMLTTYVGDGSPLPSFSGEPVAMPFVGSPEDVISSYWNALNAENKISLALKVIDPVSGHSSILVRNRFDKVSSST
jgi:IMP cyclohydrolase